MFLQLAQFASFGADARALPILQILIDLEQFHGTWTEPPKGRDAQVGLLVLEQSVRRRDART